MAAARRGFYELGQRPHRYQQFIPLASTLSGRQGGLVATQAVIENRPCVLGEGEYNTLAAPRDHRRHSYFEEDHRLRFDPTKAR